MKKTPLEKTLTLAAVIGGLASLGGIWLYLPQQVAELKQVQKLDHDVLVELKADVKNITSRLDRNNVNGNWIEQKYYEKYLAATNGLLYLYTTPHGHDL